MEFKNIIYEKKDNIAIITINRPHVLNAINRETLVEMLSALTNAEKDPSVKALIITGAGNKAFCVGVDVNEFKDKSLVELLDFMELGHKVINTIDNYSKPVIAAVNGYALGGGLELTLVCDFTIASTNAKFGQPEINLGLFPGWGGTQRLVRFIGPRKAKELILLGEMISAEEALQLGLINKIVPLENLREEAFKIAKKLMDKSPIALKFARLAINAAFKMTLPEGLDYERISFITLCRSEDAQEGVKAFLEKRKPVWKGR